MKKKMKKLELTKDTVRSLDGAVKVEQVGGGGPYAYPRTWSPSDGSYTACDVC